MTPTLSQVLAGGAKTASFNYLYLVALAAAAGAALFSVVKGLAVYRRGRLICSVVEDKPSLIDIEKQKKIEKLAFLVEELKSEKERLSRANQSLSERAISFDVFKQKEEVLRKSNLLLARECEKLKNQKEQLILKSAPPLIEAPPHTEVSILIEEEKPALPEKKNSTKAKKPVKSTKGVARKPGRVSKKKK